MSKKKKNPPIRLAKPEIKEINFAYQKVVSYSQFNNWAQCPNKWFLTSVEKKHSPPNINMVFGTAIHHVLQSYLTEMFATSGAQADRLPILEMFENKYVEEYQTQYDSNKKTHFSTPEEMREYYDDGVEIINWFLKNRSKYFTTRNCWLLGVEMPLQVEVKNNVIFTGYIDLVMYDEDLDKITIFDFKTSTKGWNDWNKKDDKKLAQILLYKKYFSELYQFPIEKIDTEFMILKRKIEPNKFVEFPKRIQTLKPASGKIKIKEAHDKFSEFIKDCFNDEGKPIMKEYTKNVTKLCDWCIFGINKDCNKNN